MRPFRRGLIVQLSLALFVTSLAAAAETWPQFRGVSGNGVAPSDGRLPSEVGPDKNVIWKTALPFGHSSPVVWGDRIYLTAVDGEALVTLAVDRNTGGIRWKREAPLVESEPIHRIGSRAQPSCATDGERVVSFFGSSGLLCYDREGERKWYRRMGPFKNGFGAGSSPIIEGGRVILNQDHDIDSFLMALDLATGETIWKTDRPEFPRGFSTPLIWNNAGEKQIVVAGTLRMVGYDFKTGEERWTVRGIARITNPTPVIGAGGNLYFACWSPGADSGDRIVAEPFAEVLEKHDADKSGALQLEEIPEGALKNRFNQIDRNKDDKITKAEYSYMRDIFATAQNVIFALKPGGKGDITSSHVLWRNHRMLPYVPSPLYYRNHLFTVKNGGIVVSLDAATGEQLKVGRVSGGGDYYSSPVAGDGKIYLISERGQLSVIRAAAQWEEIASADFGEDAYATPAIVDGRIYLRTRGHLYCFGYGK